LYFWAFFFVPPSDYDSDAIEVTGAQSLELEALKTGDGTDCSKFYPSFIQVCSKFAPSLLIIHIWPPDGVTAHF
jgi:hypothetical protein